MLPSIAPSSASLPLSPPPLPRARRLRRRFVDLRRAVSTACLSIALLRTVPSVSPFLRGGVLIVGPSSSAARRRFAAASSPRSSFPSSLGPRNNDGSPRLTYASLDEIEDVSSAPPSPRRKRRRRRRRRRRFWAKTEESFKLHELLLLEWNLNAQARRRSRRDRDVVSFDGRTGSYLLSWEQEDDDDDDDDPAEEAASAASTQPPSIRRCEYVGVELARGKDGPDLVQNVRRVEDDDDEGGLVGASTKWTLEYKRFGPSPPPSRGSRSEEKKKRFHSSRTLTCAVAQAVRSGPAAIDPAEAEARLAILDYSGGDQATGGDDGNDDIGGSDGGGGLSLVRLILPRSDGGDNDDDGRRRRRSRSGIKRLWAGRPFQYSGATNPRAASVVVDLLADLAVRGRGESAGPSPSERDPETSSLILLDPTCGSGTFLHLALSNGMNAIGRDVNPVCVEGALRNLRYAHGTDVVERQTSVKVADSSRSLSSSRGEEDNDDDDGGPFLRPEHCDCVAANLPWGRNTIDRVGENERIVTTIRDVAKSGVPCAFVTKDDNAVRDCLVRMGFEILGVAHVPPRGFVLPKSRKKKKKEGSKGKGGTEEEEPGDDEEDGEGIELSSMTRRSSDCVVTITLSPPSRK